MSDTLITTVETRRAPIIVTAEREREQRMATPIILPLEFLAEIERQRRKATELHADEKFAIAWNITTIIIPFLFKIIWNYYMGNWKTTITAVVTAVAAITAQFGFNLGAEVQTVIISIGLALVGFFAKDGDTAEAKG